MSEWEAYYILEPFGIDIEDHRVARICEAIINSTISVWGKRGARKVRTKDLIPKYGPKVKRRKQTVEEMKEILMSIAKGSKELK